MKKLQFVLLLCLLLWIPKVEAQLIRVDKKMTSSQKRQLLAFVGDVVSVGIQRDFEKSAISNQELVRFGIYQTALHRIRFFQDQGGHGQGRARLASKHVTDAAAEFFGKTIRHQSVGHWEYKHGYYNGYYELFEQLGLEQIKRLKVEGVGTSHLTVYADYVDSMASSDSNKDVIVKTKMTLKRILSKGRSHYILTSYKSLNKNFSR